MQLDPRVVWEALALLAQLGLPDIQAVQVWAKWVKRAVQASPVAQVLVVRQAQLEAQALQEFQGPPVQLAR